MQTPYEVLQLKQKQKRKIISQLQKKRAFSFKSSKHGANVLQYHIEKDQSKLQGRYSRKPSLNHNQNQRSNSQKKYEIVFRESIRKVNAYRTKVYHTHNALKRENFLNRLIATANQTQSPREKNFLKNYSTMYPKNKPKTKVKTCNPEKQFQSLSLGKYRIFFMPSPEKPSQNQIVPEFSVEKCKLNLSDNDYKQKLQRTIQSLYDHNRKIQLKMRNRSIDIFTERDDLSEETQPQNITLKFFGHVQPAKATIKSPRSTNYLKGPGKSLKEGAYANMVNSQTSNMEETKIANFIRNKKKKRLPISTLRMSKANDNQDCQFKRTITDDFSNRWNKQSPTNQLHERYFSPNKFSRCGARIKFNSIEENISGWQFQPLDNAQMQNQAKTPLPLD